MGNASRRVATFGRHRSQRDGGMLLASKSATSACAPPGLPIRKSRRKRTGEIPLRCLWPLGSIAGCIHFASSFPFRCLQCVLCSVQRIGPRHVRRVLARESHVNIECLIQRARLPAKAAQSILCRLQFLAARLSQHVVQSNPMSACEPQLCNLAGLPGFHWAIRKTSVVMVSARPQSNMKPTATAARRAAVIAFCRIVRRYEIGSVANNQRNCFISCSL